MSRENGKLWVRQKTGNTRTSYQFVIPCLFSFFSSISLSSHIHFFFTTCEFIVSFLVPFLISFVVFFLLVFFIFLLFVSCRDKSWLAEAKNSLYIDCNARVRCGSLSSSNGRQLCNIVAYYSYTHNAIMLLRRKKKKEYIYMYIRIHIHTYIYTYRYVRAAVKIKITMYRTPC